MLQVRITSQSMMLLISANSTYCKYTGTSEIQWQSEYEAAARNNQTPRTPVEQMTQQFGAVNIRSPEQTDEQNSMSTLKIA